MLFLGFSGVVGSEFLPHLDEGAIWVRGTLAPSTGPSAGIDLANRARRVLASFPEARQVVSQVGRPDDGSDASGFYNTEFFVDLAAPREMARRIQRRRTISLPPWIKSLKKFPGVDWNFSQPISDNVEEAVSGVKGELAVKLFGTDLKVLEAKGGRNPKRDEQRSPESTDLGHISSARPAKRESGRGSRSRRTASESMSATCRMQSKPP